MQVRNNYNECLTNLACSIRKYFGLDYKHNTLKDIDDILEQEQPKNVVLMLFDGMGSRILNRTLEEDSFFARNMDREITTVFPATTTAATTTVRTGLNPVEHGWLGWNMYIKPIDKIITLFFECEKGKDVKDEDFLKVKDKLVRKSIAQEINEKGTAEAVELYPFPVDKTVTYSGLDDMLRMVKEETQKDGKRFIYAYDDEPDHTMHEVGPDHWKVKELMEERSQKVEKLCEELEDTLVIIIADHGHKKVEHDYLRNYPEITSMLERNTSIEQRAVSFKIKDGYKEKFVKAFNELFGKDYTLYTKEDVIASGLFGDGEPNELFEDALGDFIAITSTAKDLVYDGDDVLYSHHAGYSDDEIYVPLIKVIKK